MYPLERSVNFDDNNNNSDDNDRIENEEEAGYVPGESTQYGKCQIQIILSVTPKG
jgi:hypothetical protein